MSVCLFAVFLFSVYFVCLFLCVYVSVFVLPLSMCSGLFVSFCVSVFKCMIQWRQSDSQVGGLIWR